MKRVLVLLGSGLLATTFAVAQDMPASSNTDASQSKQTKQSYQTSNGVIRGCLSGSAGNYTITDQNGMQYEISGPDNQLQASVGHEVEVMTRQDQASATSAEGDRTTSTTTNSVQVSNVRDVASTCTAAHPDSTSPMHNENGTTPKGTPDAAEPPQPQTMAMLQQDSKPDAGANSPQQTTPPVTSQTPATPGASTSSAQQATSPSSSGTTTTNQQTTTPSNSNGMSGSQVDQSAQGARQGEANANPNAGNANGANPSSTTNSNANDQNKPLYERPATDVPWANHSGNTSGAAGTSNPPQH
jgi:hypothetical protein